MEIEIGDRDEEEMMGGKENVLDVFVSIRW